MTFEVYGKRNCALCDSTKAKLGHLLGKLGADEDALVRFVDLDTVQGRADGAFYDVRAVPTTIVRADSGDELTRFAGTIPPSEAIRGLVTAGWATQ